MTTETQWMVLCGMMFVVGGLCGATLVTFLDIRNIRRESERTLARGKVALSELLTSLRDNGHG